VTRPAVASEWKRDWLAEAHLIARAAPGLGNPLDLTVAEFDRHLGLAISGGQVDERPWHRRFVEESIR
jgi:hypothetical protein